MSLGGVINDPIPGDMHFSIPATLMTPKEYPFHTHSSSITPSQLRHSILMKGADTGVSPPPVVSHFSSQHTRAIRTYRGQAMTTAKAKKPAAAPDNKSIEQKWGKELVAAGWTAIPNVIFDCSRQLGLKQLDVLIIVHLASFWWTAGNDPFPTKETLAGKIGCTPRTVQRAIAGLEERGYIQRHARKSKQGGNLANSYSFEGLIKAAAPFAKAIMDAREKQKAAGDGTAKPKKAKPLELVK